MANRPFRRIGLLATLVLTAAACSHPSEHTPAGMTTNEPAGTARAEISPFDIIELPLERVPEPSPRTVFHPKFQDPATGTFVQVLRVLDDPQEIPLDRWLYTNPTGEDAILHPNASEMRDRFEGAEPTPLAVYIKVQAPLDAAAADPFFKSGNFSENPSDAWPPLGVIDPGSDLRLPCAPLEYADDRRPYTAPDTGVVVDPQGFTPPRPWYEPDQQIGLGDTREGWILCLSAVSTIEAQLKWRAQPEEAMDEEEITAWGRLNRLPVGAWNLIEDAEVVAWNFDGEVHDEEGPAPPPSPGATPTSSIPAEGVQIVYEGPVWVSVGTGMSYTREATGPQAGSSLTFDVIGVPPPGKCTGVGMWYRQQEPHEVICHSNQDGRFGRFSLQFYFPGMEDLLEEWDRMALRDRVDLDLYAQSELDGLIASFEGVQVQSEFTWLEADLPDEIWRVWLSITEPGRDLYTPSLPVWEVDLYNADYGPSSTELICEEQSCLNLDELPMDSNNREALRLKMAVPILDLGEEGHGITIREARTVDQTILVNDNLHGQDFLPQKHSDPWLIIKISSVTDRAGDVYLLYPEADGTYKLEPFEFVALYQGTGGEIAVRYGVHAEVRGAEHGLALLGTLPRSVSLIEAYLILSNTGPAWRLR